MSLDASLPVPDGARIEVVVNDVAVVDKKDQTVKPGGEVASGQTQDGCLVLRLQDTARS
jgi:hypothetical protein